MMSDEEAQNTPQISLRRGQTTHDRPFSGTQLRQSCSATELGTPSGEVILNLRRQRQRREQDQADLPLGGNPPMLSFIRGGSSEPEKTVHSDRMGMLEKMLASVGDLRGEIEREMTTLTRGSRCDTARSAGVQVLAGPNRGTAEERDSGAARVVGHTGSRSRSPGLFRHSRGMTSFEEAVPEAEGAGVRTDTSDASVHGRGNHDFRMQERESRRPYGRTWTDNDQTSRTIPLTNFNGRASNKKPATYDGTSSFQDYLVQFNMTGDLNHWEERTKAMELATSLRGAAQTVLSDLRPEQRTDFDQLISALTARFEPTNQTELYRAQIKGRLRKKSESVQELATDIKRLVRRAYPQATNDLKDQIARDCFIDSINEHELEWFVYQGKPKTVDEAMQLALEYEAFQVGRKRVANVRQCSTKDQAEKTSDVDKILNRLKTLESKFETMVSQTSANLTCYKCRARGHKARDCPQNQAQSNHPYNRYHNYQNRQQNYANAGSENTQSNRRQGNSQ